MITRCARVFLDLARSREAVHVRSSRNEDHVRELTSRTSALAPLGLRATWRSERNAHRGDALTDQLMVIDEENSGCMRDSRALSAEPTGGHQYTQAHEIRDKRNTTTHRTRWSTTPGPRPPSLSFTARRTDRTNSSCMSSFRSIRVDRRAGAKWRHRARSARRTRGRETRLRVPSATCRRRAN